MAGLGLGVACSLLIFLFVRDELGFDRFHEQADRIHRIDVSWHILVLAGLVAFGIALLTVSYHAIRAAWTDPVMSLRYE